MKKLTFVTDTAETVAEINEVLSEFQISSSIAERISDEGIGDFALRQAIRLYVQSGIPTLCLLTDICFEDPLSSYQHPNLRSVESTQGYGAIHGGKQGVMRIAYAFTADGLAYQQEVKNIPGAATLSPRGEGGTLLDQIWIPKGYQYTLAEMSQHQRFLGPRQVCYRLAAKLLGSPFPQEVYEAHITVELPGGTSYAAFQGICAELRIKAIHIELDGGASPTHFMTASMHVGLLSDVREEISRLSKRLEERGLKPVRIKIEAMIHNDLVPKTDAEAIGRPASNYFELHAKVTVPTDKDLYELRELCRPFKGHIARSASNRLGDSLTQRFVTLRFRQTGWAHAQATFSEMTKILLDHGYKPSHLLHEYVVSDDNLSLDAGWADSEAVINCHQGCEMVNSNLCPFQAAAPVGIAQDSAGTPGTPCS